MKTFAIDDDALAALAREHGTPLYVYDAATIERRVRDLAGFDVVRYAQKANSTRAVLEVVRRAGALVDAVSAGEVERALRAGWSAHEIAFTADLFERAALDVLARHACPLTLGSPFQIEQCARLLDRREVALRVNPGFGHGHAPTVSTGGASSKHGIWHVDLPRCVELARELGLRVSGLHVHIGSGSDFDHLTSVRDALSRLSDVVAADLATISVGGGLPIPYRESDAPFDVRRFTDAWLATRADVERRVGRRVRIEVEPGRYLVAESGVLLAEVRGAKSNGGVEFVFVDAGFHTLARPALYGAFHAVRALGAPRGPLAPRVVAGPLCESGDVLTRTADGTLAPQMLPPLAEGDLVCVHDAGAYGTSMASTYNSQPLPAEVLVDGGRARLVRSRQTIDALVADEH